MHMATNHLILVLIFLTIIVSIVILLSPKDETEE
jgi:hypothetical protein